MATVTLEHVTVPLRAFDLRLTLEVASTLALVGPSGAGKTTVLRAVAGLTSVRLGSGELVYSTDEAQGEVEVVVYPWEVSIARMHADDSALNLVRGQIGSLAEVGNRIRVRVGPLTAEVTATSAKRLGLARGVTAYASFKATGTRLVPLGARASASRRTPPGSGGRG